MVEMVDCKVAFKLVMGIGMVCKSREGGGVEKRLMPSRVSAYGHVSNKNAL
jgi:hypothetical protein